MDQNVSETKLSQQKCLKCFREKKKQVVTQLFLNSLHFTTQLFKMEQTFMLFCSITFFNHS